VRVNKYIKGRGFTLIELMISMMLGLIVIGGALSIYISTIKSSGDIVKSARLNYNLDSVMQLMVNDIRRAGYWGLAISGSNAVNDVAGGTLGNPFTVGTANIQIAEMGGESAGSCILYTYDGENSDGALDDGSVIGKKGEYYGFRLNNGRIDIRYQATGVAKTCDAASWEVITNENLIEITSLQFSFLPVGPLVATTRCLKNPDTSFNTTCALTDTAGSITAGDLMTEKRIINIILSGRVKNDNNVIKTISSSVQVRAPYIYVKQP